MSKAPPTASKRLLKELSELSKNPVEGLEFDADKIASNLTKWHVILNGAAGTLYSGEKFELQFTFGDKYPFDSPQVIFIGKHIPVHPHIYTNGHICLSILTDDWTPAMSVSSVCLSIVSMLSSCKKKELPPDNNSYVKTASSNPKKTRWWFHDDTV
ncbi:ubiquitin-conjugating enzyme E2 W-like [Clytia hemisphaerica]|uniref:N-terminal E2 ubiquitin-conjugating enzyme n=1 Tax=Clytia hemisphaerica TaxID=252671 RepID=A0A7M5WTC9_9CNID|eukprot:TCONS_00009317-protein